MKKTLTLLLLIVAGHISANAQTVADIAKNINKIKQFQI